MKAQLSFGMQASYRNSLSFFPSDTIPHDTLKIARKKMPTTEKATIMSACVPGLGQIYNKKWWKLPIIYAGFGGLGYAFWVNNRYVKEYGGALRFRYDNNPATVDTLSRYSDDNLVTLKNYYQRFRDLSVIGMAALYTLQVVDACVDAHLATFDVSDDLSMNISPAIYKTPQGMVTSVGLRFYYR